MIDVAYTVGGRRLVVESLDLHEVPDVQVGTRLCLEAAAGAPGVVRLCGQTYPEGQLQPVYVLCGVLGVVAVCTAVGRFVVVRRERAAREAASG